MSLKTDARRDLRALAEELERARLAERPTLRFGPHEERRGRARGGKSGFAHGQIRRKSLHFAG